VAPAIVAPAIETLSIVALSIVTPAIVAPVSNRWLGVRRTPPLTTVADKMARAGMRVAAKRQAFPVEAAAHRWAPTTATLPAPAQTET